VTAERSDRAATLAAAGASLAMVTFQLAGKATRDALYLSTFSVATLPRMVAAAAILSAVVVILLSRVMARIGPMRLVPPLFVASALLLLGEWALSGPARPVAAVLLYLHFCALGALLVSGFWAAVTERFDPRAARGAVGQISAGASIGSILGGLLPALVGSRFPLTAMFPVLAVLHVLSAAMVVRVGARRIDRGTGGRTEGEALIPRQVFRASAYLRGLVLLVVLTGAAEGLLDFVFKVRVTDATRGGEGLLRIFAQFYMATALVSLLIQATLLRRTLAWLGTARTAALLPAGVTAGALGGLLLPGLASMVAARGLEMVLRNSIFRGAYELLFTPVTPPEKRSVKLLVDVGASRLGDIFGAALIQCAVLLAAAWSASVILGVTMALAVGALLVARWLHFAYTTALARNLAFRAEQIEVPVAETATLLQSVAGFDLRELRSAEEAAPTPAPAADAPVAAGVDALSSADPAVVRAALLAGPLAPDLAERAITLLAWDAVAPSAAEALVTLGPAHADTLIRHLRDPDEEFSVRRRLVRVLAQMPTPEVVRALVEALTDRRFEVRFRAGRALSQLHGRVAGAEPDREQVLALVLKEVMVERTLWESRRLIDEADDGSAPLEVEVVRSRADRSLEHVFTLLTLVLPRESLRLAYLALQTDDRHLRGTALEYLESVLPPVVRERLWQFLEPEGPARAAGSRSPEEVLDNLLKSRGSIVFAVEALRRKSTPPS
jgi:AAA family ATP:ADP antiporter